MAKKISKEEAQRRADAEMKQTVFTDPILPLPGKGKKPAAKKPTGKPVKKSGK